jgi:hypothetical protein
MIPFAKLARFYDWLYTHGYGPNLNDGILVFPNIGIAIEAAFLWSDLGLFEMISDADVE